ncbi:MAG: hypothetical protein AB9903_24360 [Vulcanimicrobiota bacterium]
MRNCILIVALCLLTLLIITGSGAFSQDPLPKEGFSKKYNVYLDDWNGYKMKIPVEFKINAKGASTNWSGPISDEACISMSVNVTTMADVSQQTLFDINLQSKKKDRAFVDVVPLKVKLGKTTVPAFSCKEAPRKPGSSAEKAGDEHHRWFLFVFGNKREYQVTLCAVWSVYKANRVQDVFGEMLKSFELVPAKEG